MKSRLSVRVIAVVAILWSILAAPAPASARGGGAGATRGASAAGGARRERDCRTHLSFRHGGSREGQGSGLEAEVREFQGLAEKSLAYRAETIKVAERLKRQIREGRPLSGRDLDTLNNGVVAHLRLREKLYGVAEAHECWLEPVPEDLPPETRLKGLLLSLGAALTLYDNYLLAISSMRRTASCAAFSTGRTAATGSTAPSWRR